MVTRAMITYMSPPPTHTQNRLVYDPATGKYNPPKGVQTRVPGFGQTSTVEYLDPATPLLTFTQYFHDLVEHFVSKHGYVRGKTIVAAPYDWRYAPSRFTII